MPDISKRPPETFGLSDDHALIDIAGIARLLGRSPKTVAVDCSRRPDTLPPRFYMPGTKAIKWRVSDVRAWMEKIAEQQAEERLRRLRQAKEAGMDPHQVSQHKFKVGRVR